ncbi:MAG: PKD domain-containing protein, partial [Planctomycetota bacterium]|nr:PKD domain-containing protein [Planctomycetota bacterium]
MLLLSVLFTIPFFLAEATTDFWLPGNLYRREVTLSTVTVVPGGKLATARFFTGDKKDTPADSVRVTTAAGKEVLFEVIYWHPRNACIILFETVKGQQSYFVFYGGKVRRSRYRKQFRKGLFMETRAWGSEGACTSWEETQKLIATGRQSYGATTVPIVRRKDNPFNQHDGRFISLFSGTLHIPKAGTHYLLTRSNDASFVFIDGKKVVEFPGTRGRANPRNDEYLSSRFRLDALPGLAKRYRSLEAVQLTAGNHTFKYVHVQAGGSTVAWFGLLPPGSRQFVVPGGPYFFSEFLPTTPGMFSVRNKPFAISASSIRHSHQVIATMQFTRTFFSCALTHRPDPGKRNLKILWDFGDGRTAEGTVRSHIYFKTGRFPVTVKVTDGRGNLDAFAFDALAKQYPPNWTPVLTSERMLIDLVGENFERLDRIDPFVFASCWQLAAYTSTWKERSDYFGRLARAYAKWYPSDPAACLSELFQSAVNAAIRSEQPEAAMALSEEAIRALTGRTRRQLDFALRRMDQASTARDHVKTIAWADEVLVRLKHVASESELERANIAKAEAFLSQLKVDAAKKVLEGMKTRRASLPSEKEVLIDAIFKGAVKTFLREKKYGEARGICRRRTFYEPLERLNPLVCQLLSEIALAEKK